MPPAVDTGDPPITINAISKIKVACCSVSHGHRIETGRARGDRLEEGDQEVTLRR